MHSLTPMKKPFKRVTNRAYKVWTQRERRIVVKLLPSDEIEFSEERGKQKVRCSVRSAFLFAIRLGITTNTGQSQLL
jgi:hypothetical protein